VFSHRFGIPCGRSVANQILSFSRPKATLSKPQKCTNYNRHVATMKTRPTVHQHQDQSYQVISKRSITVRARGKELVDLRGLTDLSGVRLTDAEFARLRQKIDLDKDGQITRQELTRASLAALEYRSARELCLSVIEKPQSWWDKLVGQHALKVCDVAGTILYAVSGTQVAGGVGMNIVGCTLVGCATALGGGTLNNLLHGSSSPLHSIPGVFWVRDPSYLAMAAGASLLTFSFGHIIHSSKQITICKM